MEGEATRGVSKRRAALKRPAAVAFRHCDQHGGDRRSKARAASNEDAEVVEDDVRRMLLLVLARGACGLRMVRLNMSLTPLLTCQFQERLERTESRLGWRLVS